MAQISKFVAIPPRPPAPSLFCLLIIFKNFKHIAAFLSESGGFYANLHVPDYASLASAIAPVLTLTTADELCDAAEHLTIIATGAMMIADRDTWSTLSKRATQILDRLINEFSHRALTDLFYRGAVARALLALSYFLAGEILDGVALLDNISQYNRLWESDPMSAQLLLQVHALRWSQLGDQRDLDIAVCKNDPFLRCFGLTFWSAYRSAAACLCVGTLCASNVRIDARTWN